MRTGGYAIWLSLDRDTEARLASVIGDLSARMNTPVFTPHITLLSGIRYSVTTILNALRILKLEFQNFTVVPEELEAGRTYFHSLYIKIQAGSTVLKLRSRGENLLNTYRPSPFYPHISLLYGHIDGKQKQDIINELNSWWQDSELEMNSLALMNTTGKPDAWKLIENIPLRD